ncbi:hypothetical protein HOP50_03g19980 [Chloropicon primus]|nr:hypothetical protein HOP50_03g19980 [Chloropicon primus]
MVRVTDWKRIAVEAEDPASLVGLRGICATTRHGLGTLFLSTQRSGAARNALQGRLPPGGDRSDAFLVVRNAANSTGLVPLGLKGHDASSTSTSSSSSSSSVPVAWFLNRRKRGAKTSTQVRASDSRDGSTAHVAVASDNKRRCEVYDVAELSSASPRPSVTLPAPFPSKGFRWKTLRVSAAGDAVCALCLDDRASSSEPSPSPSLWLWTRYSGQWNRVDVAQPVDDDGTNRVSLAFAEGRNKFVALSCRVSPAAASPLLLERTEVDLKPSLDLTGPRNLAGGSMGRTSRAEVDLPRGFAPASKVQALDARGSLFAVAVSCERDFAVLVLDEGLGTRGVGLPPPSLASDLLVVAVTVFDLPSASTVGVATLCRGGLFCVFDDRGRLLRVLQTQPCMTTGSTPPSLAPLHFGGQQYIACAANDGEVRVLGVQSGDPGTDEEDDDWEAEVEEDLEAEEEERRKGSKAAEEVYFDFLESLLTVSSYGKPFDTLLGDFEGVLTTLGSKLGPRLVLNSLHDMILTLCEEEEHLASLWLLEAAEGLGNREERDWSRGLTSLDWLNLWQILANSVFESLEQRGDGEGARDGGFYHEVASALWKRLASSGFDSLAKSQFDAANDGVFGGQGDLAGMILDADRAFVHGDLHKSLALYREAGAEASLSHIACCIHSDMAEECLEATYSLLCVGEEGGIMPPGLSQGELRSMKAEACSELGRLLIEAHRPSQNDAAGGVTFPSPLSWSTRGGHGHEGTTCRRLSLDWNKLRESLKKGRAASPSLALGLFLHSLQASKVSMLVDASLLWDYLGHWRRAVCLLKACGRVFKSYGKDKAAEHIGRETVLYLKSKLEGKLGDLDVLLDGNSLGEFDSIFRTFLLLPESATKSETFGVLMKKLQASVNKEIAKSLSVIDLRSLQGLGETCTRLYKLVGALCSVLVSISRPVYSLEDLSYGENGVLQVSGATNVGDECYESLSSAYEDMIQLSRTIRSYALLALQWQSWQSSASAKERKEFMKETVLCLALILSSDPGSAAQRSQKVQKMACWILKEFISAEVFQEDPALVSLVKNSIPMGCMTGPTRKALESISGEAGLDTENLEEEAEAYMDILQSDSAAYVHDLFGICSEAIAWTETNIDDKSFDDEGLSLIHLALLEGFASFPRGPRDNDSQDPKWPTLDMCIAHPLNCGANFNIDADERVLANILTLGPFATGSSSDTEEGDVFSEVSEIDVVESVIVDEEEEGLNVIRLVFRNVQGLETEDSGDSSSTVLNIRIDVGDDDVSLPPEESTTFTDSSCEEERLILNSIAENLVNDAITEAISQALVEGAIAHAISAAAQVQETAEPVLDQEDVKSSDVAEEEPDTSSAEIAAKALVEDAIAYAISRQNCKILSPCLTLRRMSCLLTPKEKMLLHPRRSHLQLRISQRLQWKKLKLLSLNLCLPLGRRMSSLLMLKEKTLLHPRRSHLQLRVFQRLQWKMTHQQQ